MENNMADEQPAKAKRRVKNPESFRERALKASEAAGQPATIGPVKRALAAIYGFVLRPVFTILKAVFTSPPLRLIGKLLRPLGKVLDKVLFINHFRASWRELRLVAWPNWRQSRQLTLAVLIFAVVFGAAIAGLDYGLQKVFKSILLK
jgi:preprotein translocase SecE subunit